MAETGFEYLAFGPESGDPKKLVVLLHGYGRNGWTMEKMALAARDAVPDALILCPHGVEPLDMDDIGDGGPDHFLHIPQELRDTSDAEEIAMLRQWFRIDGNRLALMPRVVHMARRMNAFIDQQRDMIGVADSDIVVMGFSQGAGLALYTAFSRDQEIAGLICHSSIVLQKSDNDPNLKSKPAIFYIYGDADPEFPLDRYQSSRDWLQSYTGGRVNEKVVQKLGHYTNAESRQHAAAFIKDVLEQ